MSDKNIACPQNDEDVSGAESMMLRKTRTPADVMRKMRQFMMVNAPKINSASIMAMSSTALEKVKIGRVEAPGDDLDSNDEGRSNGVGDPASTAVRAVGKQTPKWTDLTMMPGMSNDAIAVLGASIFAHFGLESGGSVRMIASTEHGDLLNSAMEVNAVLNFLENYAQKHSEDNMVMSFEGVIDGYAPQVRLYHTENFAYLAVFEDTGVKGRYIYAFKRSGNKLEYGVEA